MPKTIKFEFEFTRPDNADVIDGIACPYCKAPKGTRCSTQIWGWGGPIRGGNKMSNLHHDRYYLFMKMPELYGSSPYSIRGIKR